jgi:hypothetical protein
MLDPFPPPPAWLRSFTEPYALQFNSPTLSDHIHEVIAAFAFYLVIHAVVSPLLSSILFPKSYNSLKPRTRLNWDIHVVSLVQSVVINAAALWVMYVDKERSEMSSSERVFAYTGACGLIQALAVGYFVYDLIVSVVYVRMFGIGMLFHAISALWVFSLGFVSCVLSISLIYSNIKMIVIYIYFDRNKSKLFHRDPSSTSMPQHLSSTSSQAHSSISTGSSTRST